MDKGIVFVTGGSRGIGRAVVEKFALAGYPVVLNYCRSKQQAEQLQQQLVQQGAQVLLQQGDIGRQADVQRMFAQVEEIWGEVEILVNNAGIGQQKLFTELTGEDWRNMFAVHVDGSFYCCQAVLPAMIRRRSGCIINLSSMWGQVGGSCEVHYSAAKGAVQAMTKALAKEVGPSGIRVNCVAPGFVTTEMNQQLDAEDVAILQEETPLGLLGETEDIANLVFFLAGDGARLITGQVIGCNGGLVI